MKNFWEFRTLFSPMKNFWEFRTLFSKRVLAAGGKSDGELRKLYSNSNFNQFRGNHRELPLQIR
jgi:hypothetical protein